METVEGLAFSSVAMCRASPMVGKSLVMMPSEVQDSRLRNSLSESPVT